MLAATLAATRPSQLRRQDRRVVHLRNRARPRHRPPSVARQAGVDAAHHLAGAERFRGAARDATMLRRSKAPFVLIVGGGQGGIALAARLKRLGVPATVVEKNARAGDSWRKRYASLCLHDPVWYDHMPYLPFPDYWPVFTPKDRMGDWLEMYVKVMQLDYRASTACTKATFQNGEWEVQLLRNGEPLTLRPKHLVLATGMSGFPQISRSIAGLENFAGTAVHSSKFEGGAAWKGKRAVVVGSGTSAHDICQDLHAHGAAEVTMIQRAPTIVVRSREPDGPRLGPALLRAGGGARHQHRDRRFDRRFRAVQGAPRAPETRLFRNQEARCGALRRTGKSRLPVRLRRGRLGHPRAVPAARRGLLHRDRRLEDDHRRQDQAEGGRERRSIRPEIRQPHRWQRARRRPGRVRHRLRLDERMGARADQPRGRRQGGQGVGPGLRHQGRSRAVGRRAAQHVEADAAAEPVVPRRQPDAVAALFAVSRSCN